MKGMKGGTLEFSSFLISRFCFNFIMICIMSDIFSDKTKDENFSGKFHVSVRTDMTHDGEYPPSPLFTNFFS